MTGTDVAALTPAEKYLSYVLGGAEYATRIDLVREIIPCQDVTSLPRLPDYMLGVTNLRGRIVPVVDLRLRLAMPLGEDIGSTCIIIAELPTGEQDNVSQVGFVADAVLEVLEIPADRVDPPPQLVRDRRQAILHGLARVGDEERLVGLLDLRQALNQDQVDELSRGDGRGDPA